MITRRKFLMLVPAAALAWEHVLAGAPESAPGYDLHKHWWGMLLDIDKCIGCGKCVRACYTENNVPAGYFRTWVERYHVSGWQLDTPEVDSPDGGLHGFPPAKSQGGKNFFVPKLCNHCEHPPCTQVCPVGATFISPDGVVLVDGTYCVGCCYCIQACPYGARFLHPTEHTASKCSLCYHRITRGLTTACCENCPTGARQLIDLKNPKDPIHKYLKTHMVEVLKPDLGSDPKAFYHDLDGSVR